MSDLKRSLGIGAILLALGGCGGRLTHETVDSVPRDDAGLGDDAEAPTPSTFTPSGACTAFTTAWHNDHCVHGCATGPACAALWTAVSTKGCGASYLCTVNHCCTDDDPSCEPDTCRCIGACLPTTPDACSTAWMELFQCIETACKGGC